MSGGAENQGGDALIAATHAFPVLGVPDLDAALACYCDRLGFALDWRADGIAVVGTGVVSLFMRVGAPAPTEVILNVENADVVADTWIAAGVEISDPVASRPWGMREFTAIDPFGNRLIVGHVDESGTDRSGFGDRR